MPYLSFSSFSEVLSCFFVWNIFLSPCFAYVRFYVLGRSVMSPGLEGLALCRKYPIGPGSTIPPGHQSQAFHGVSFFGLCVHSSFIWSLLLWTNQWVGLVPLQFLAGAALAGHHSVWGCLLVLHVKASWVVRWDWSHQGSPAGWGRAGATLSSVMGVLKMAHPQRSMGQGK